jgi:ParB-like chromosome segregation protein Spo0J
MFAGPVQQEREKEDMAKDKHNGGARKEAGPPPDEKVEFMPVTEIYSNDDWNARGKRTYLSEAALAAGDQPDGSTGMRGLVNSMVAGGDTGMGQDTPISIRPNPWKSASHPQEWTIVAGFRRYAAIVVATREYQDAMAKLPPSDRRPGLPCQRGLIRVIKLGDTSETKARLLNIRENTAREDMPASSLAHAVVDACKDRGEMTDKDVGETLGISQNYVSLLNRIHNSILLELWDAWKEANVQLAVSEMEAISKLPQDQQQTEYQKLLETRKGKTKGAGPGRGNWIETAKTKIAGVASVVGRLHHEGHIDASEIDWLEAVPLLLPDLHKKAFAMTDGVLTEEATEARKTLAGEAVAAYLKAQIDPKDVAEKGPDPAADTAADVAAEAGKFGNADSGAGEAEEQTATA